MRHVSLCATLVFFGCTGAIGGPGSGSGIGPGPGGGTGAGPGGSPPGGGGGDSPAPGDDIRGADGTTFSASEREKLSQHDPLAGFPTGEEQRKILCAEPGAEKVRQVFCAASPPKITGLKDLQKALGFDTDGFGGNTRLAVSGHSSSLVTKFTSAINPRVIVFTFAPPATIPPDYVAMGFVRGEQFAEIIAKDPAKPNPSFFLVKFRQACNAAPGGCKPGDLLTPDVESGWTEYSIYNERQVLNTIVDCSQCHQPEGPTTKKVLRMQERLVPWTHFMFRATEGGTALLNDFVAAHPLGERYGGILVEAIRDQSEPPDLQGFVEESFRDGPQPNEFQTGAIEGEVKSSSPQQPVMNSPPGTSATWTRLFEGYAKGQFIPPPYHDVKVTEPGKLAAMTKAYRDVAEGRADKASLPDIREVFRDDRRWEIAGQGVKPGSSGAEILVAACSQCHNAKLDQTVSRARFNVDLSLMSREEKDKAIRRISLPEDSLLRMPPTRFRSLSEDEKARLSEHLRR